MNKAKLPTSNGSAPTRTDQRGYGIDLGFGRVSRHCATALAILAGCLAVANLWLVPLSEASLLEAGRGVILLLLGIGLMGTARLSLFLTLIVASSGVGSITATTDILRVMAVMEVCLITTAAFALVTSR
ncbi:MAG: hypothetical protein P8Q31_09680 [Luminiphilus sp.]|jgi:hypothetical protein|nr:hypothetical protein [Luminiphilus sp.]MDG1461785.1 hypothetical protein [Luminiphilus sp.]